MYFSCNCLDDLVSITLGQQYNLILLVCSLFLHPIMDWYFCSPYWTWKLCVMWNDLFYYSWNFIFVKSFVLVIYWLERSRIIRLVWIRLIVLELGRIVVFFAEIYLHGICFMVFSSWYPLHGNTIGMGCMRIKTSSELGLWRWMSQSFTSAKPYGCIIVFKSYRTQLIKDCSFIYWF